MKYIRELLCGESWTRLSPTWSKITILLRPHVGTTSLGISARNFSGSCRRVTFSSGLVVNSLTTRPMCLRPHPRICAFAHVFVSRSTGKERDTESGNDYFGARYYASSMGRFMSPDWSAQEEPVPYAKLEDPQTLNLYSYVRNNPLAGVDADGHDGPGVVEEVEDFVKGIWEEGCPSPKFNPGAKRPDE